MPRLLQHLLVLLQESLTFGPGSTSATVSTVPKRTWNLKSRNKPKTQSATNANRHRKQKKITTLIALRGEIDTIHTTKLKNIDGSMQVEIIYSSEFEKKKRGQSRWIRTQDKDKQAKQQHSRIALTTERRMK